MPNSEKEDATFQEIELARSSGGMIHFLRFRTSEAPTRGRVIIVPGRGVAAEEYAWLAAPLGAAGWSTAVVCLPGQGSDGDDDRGGPQAVADVRTCLDYFSASDPRPGQIALVGHSTGAGIALRALAEDDRVTTAIALCVIGDLLLHTRNIEAYLPSYVARLSALVGGSAADDTQAYEYRSPARFASRLRRPVLLVAAELDRVAPPYQSDLLAERIRAGGGTCETFVVERAGHFFEAFAFTGSYTQVVVERVRRWLDQHAT
jgi:dipeptidyl aminopeptidase/acylaminoacyl peptidase